MHIAGLVYARASVAVISAFAVCSCESMSSTPVVFEKLLVGPAGVQVGEMGSTWLVVCGWLELLRVDFSHAECSRAKLHSGWGLGAASLGHVVEVLAAHLDVLDPEAVTVLPGVLDLMVAEPGLAVEGALFVFLVQGSDVLPAGVAARFSLDALVREIVEVGRVDSLHEVSLDVQNVAVE